MKPNSSLAQNCVIPAQAGIQMIKASPAKRDDIAILSRFAGCLFLLDSRLIKLLVIRLSWHKTPAKSLVMRGNDGLMDYLA